MHNRTLCIILFFILGNFSVSLCAGNSEYQLTQGAIFNTKATIKYKYKRSLDKEIFARLDSFDLSLNPFNKKSTIYKVNNNIPAELDDWFITVFNCARLVSELSGGIYDITAGPLINAWGFGYEKADKFPDQTTIDSIKQFVGYQKVRIEGRTLIKDNPHIQINASSLAKGYAVDVIAELLEAIGINDYMVEIGGEIRVRGNNPENNTWKIGITKPVDDNTGHEQENIKVLEMHKGAMATSGNSRNYYIKDGKKYSHILNPLTGYPVNPELLSATVFFPDCITADAFATAFIALDLQNAVKLANSIQNLGYLFIYKNEKGEFVSISN